MNLREQYAVENIHLLKQCKVKNRDLQAEIERLQKQLDETPSGMSNYSKGWVKGYDTAKSESKESIDTLQEFKDKWKSRWLAQVNRNKLQILETDYLKSQLEKTETAQEEIKELKKEVEGLKYEVAVLKNDELGWMKLVIEKNNVINELKKENEELKQAKTKMQNNLEDLMSIIGGPR